MYGHVLPRPWQGQRPSFEKKRGKTKRFLLRSRHNVCFDRFHVNDPSWFVLNTFSEHDGDGGGPSTVVKKIT